ncbi:hypothetical protein [Streptomyces yaizuensis]|uniref:DUF4321 domain-containing protein n=1 Tax=Streptomyces yaizuensis TaxID=2989713 RepID=A0ABQ5P5X2_9ACTN|nr:hypothetical protein [Streptomyces sp. YSPA8]GLF97976.1 hypothetical protein SYYSPA8_26785 [Streptomyces sp. YSPA8]
MNRVLGWVGGVLLVLGVCGVVRELTGWFPVMGATRFLTENVTFFGERAVFTNVVIAVVGFALVMTGERLKDRPGAGGGQA